MNAAIPLRPAAFVRFKGLAGAVLAAVGMLAALERAHAADVVKTNTTGILTSGTSWVSGTAPTSADVAVWNNTVTGANNSTLGGTTSWLGIKIVNPGGAVTITNAVGDKLTLGGSGIDMSGATQNLNLFTTSGSATLVIGANQDWNVATGRTLTMFNTSSNQNNRMTGSGNINVKGGGSVIMNIGDGSTSGTGTDVSNGNAQYSGNWNMSGGSVVVALHNGSHAFGSGTITLDNATIAPQQGNWSWSNNIVVGAGGGTVSGSNTSSATRYLDLTGVISGNGTLTIGGPGSGATWGEGVILTGVNTFAGPITINSTGVMRIGGAATTTTNSEGTGTLGSIPSSVAITNNGILGFGWSNDQTFANAIAGTGIVRHGSSRQSASSVLSLTGTSTYSGATQVYSGTLEIGGAGLLGNGSYGGNILINSATNVFRVATSQNQVLSGTITGLGQLIKAAAGTLQVTGTNNSYTGATRLIGGTTEASKLAAGGANSSLGAATNVAANLIFNGGALSYTGTGDSTDRAFTITSAPTINANGSGALTWTAAAPTFSTTNTAYTITLGGSSTAANTFGTPIGDNGTGAIGITKADAGTWVLSGANSYSGLTTISGGTLSISGNLSLGSNVAGVAGSTLSFGANTITIGNATAGNSNGVYSGKLDGTGTIQLRGGGNTVMNADGTTGVSGNAFAIVASTSNFPTSPFALDTGSSLTDRKDFGFRNDSGDVLQLTSLIGYGAIRGDAQGNGTPRFITVNQAADTTFNGALLSHVSTGTVVRPLTFEKQGAGTLTLAGFIGKQTLLTVSGSTAPLNLIANGGMLLVTNTFNSTTTNTDAINSSGTVTITSGTLGFAPQALVNNAGTAGVAAIQMNGGVLRWHGTNTQDLTAGAASRLTLVAGKTATFDTNGNDVTLASALGGGAVNAAVTKIGGGQLSLDGANTYTGDTTITSGTLRIGGSGQLGSGSYAGAIANAAALRFASSANQTLAGAISGTGSLTQAGSGALTLTGSSTYTGNTTISSGTLEVGGAGRLGGGAYAGAIANDGALRFTTSANQTLSGGITGNGSLVKSGGGRLTLQGANPYSGATTVNGGTLAVNGQVTASAITVTSGGYLGGSGTTADVTLAAGATVSPGNSPGLLTVANMTWSGSSSYDWQIYSTALGEGTGWDSIAGTGSLTVNATSASPFTFNLISLSGTNTPGPANTWNPKTSGTFRLASFAGGVSLADPSGTWWTMNTGGFSPFDPSTGAFTLSLTTNDINLVYTYTPPPQYVWTVGSGSWSTAANWDTNTAPSGTPELFFSGSGGTATNDIVSGTDAGQIAVVKGITFTGSASGAYTLDGNAFNLGTLGITNNSTYQQTVQNGITLTANTTLNAATAGLLFSGTIDTAGAILTVTGSSPTTLASVVTGSGSLVKLGSGTLTLAGANAYTGATTLNEGTVVVGDGATSGVLPGNVTNNAALVFDRSDDVTYAGVIGGNGGVTKVNVGTLTLTGSSGYTGGTTISGGTLQIGAGGTAGSISGTVTNNAALAFNRSDDVTFAGVVNGSGAVTKLGAGALALTSSNGYSGGTTLAAGTIRLGNDAALGTGTAALNAGTMSANGGTARSVANPLVFGGDVTLGDATNNGNLTFSGPASLASGTRTLTVASTVTMSGIVSAGGLIKAGPATLTLTGVNTYAGDTTISSGTLVLGGAGQLGGGAYAGAIANAGTLSVATSANQTLSGAVTGVGSLVKTGAGTLMLSNASNGYTGGSTITGGTVSFASGALGPSGAVTVNNAALQWATGNTDDLSSRLTLVNSTTATLDTNGNNVTLATGFGGSTTAGVTKVGGGTLTLAGNNTYTGTTTVSAGTLQLGAGGSTGSVAGNIANGTAVVFNRSDAVTYGGVISGIGSLTQAGSGTLTLSSANTYTGNTTINAGVLQIGAGSTTGAISASSAVTIGAGGTLTLNRSDSPFVFASGIAGSGTLVKSGAGETQLTGSNSFSGLIDVRQNKLAIESVNALAGVPSVNVVNAFFSLGTALAGGTATIANLTGSGTVDGQYGSTGTRTLSVTPTTSNTFAGVIRDATSGTRPLALVKAGPNTLTLSGANGYTQGTTLVSGTLVAANSSALGSGGTVTINTAATGASDTSLLIDASAASITIARAISVANQGSGVTTIGSGSLAGSNQAAFSGAITLAKDVTLFGADSGDRTQFQGGIGGTGNVTVTTAGSGRVIFLTTANTFSGSLTISPNSVLQLSDGTSTTSSLIPDAADVTVGAGGVLRISKGANSESINALLGSGTVTGFTSTPTLIVGASGGSGTFSGVLTQQGGGVTLALTKQGAGTQVLSGVSNYTGVTTVTAGTLAFTTSNFLGSGLSNASGDTGVTSFGSNTLTMGTGNANLNYYGTLDGTGTIALRGGSNTIMNSNGSAGTTGNTQFFQSSAVFPQAFNLDTGDSTTSRKDFGFTNDASVPLVLASLTGYGAIRGDANGVANATTMRFITVNQAIDTVFNGAIVTHKSSGNASRALTFEKQGAGTLTLAGFLGKSTVSAGTGAVPLNIIVNGGGLIITDTDNTQTTNTGAINTSGTVTVTSGTLGFANLSLINAAGSTGVASIRMNGGVLRWQGVNTQDITAGGRLTLVSGSTATFDTNGNDVTLATAFGGGAIPAAVTKIGAGKLTLTASNAYTGATTVSSGTLALSPGGTLQSTSGLTVNSGATALISSSNWLVAGHGTAVDATRVITVNGGTIVFDSIGESRIGNVTLANGGTFTSNRGLSAFDVLLANVSTGAATVTVSGNAAAAMNGSGGIHLQGVQNFDVADVTGDANADLTVSLILGDPGSAGGAAGGVNKTGAGTLVLTAANTYTGPTTISTGTLEVGGAGGLGGGAYAGAISNDGALRFTTSANQTLSGGITGGGSLVKSGGGRLTLTGANSYAGATTVDGGTLVVNGQVTSSAITVTSGATLGGSGTTADVTLAAGATVSPGNSPGLLTVANMTWSGSSSYDVQMYDYQVGAGTGWDSILGTGSLTVNATAGSPFTFNLISLSSTNSNTPGPAFNWSQTTSGSFRLASFTGGISLADPSGTWWSLNTVGFTPLDPSLGAFSLSLTTNDIYLVYTYTPPPQFVWTAGSGVWSGAGNWDGNTAPTGTPELSFSGPGGTSTNDITTGTGAAEISLVKGITFTGSAGGAYTLDGNAFNLDSLGVTNNSAYQQTVQNGITLAAGSTLNAATAGLVFSGTIDTNGAILTVTGSNPTTLSSVVTGSGSLTKLGAGTLTLSNSPNGYTGGSTISRGTVSFASGALGPSGSVTVGNATLQWATGNTDDLSPRLTLVNSTTATLDTNGNDVTLATGFGGATSGAMTKVGAGTLTLAGNNTYAGMTTVSGGTLQIGGGGATGRVAGDITTDAALVFNRSDSVTYAGVVGGSGSVTQAGSGTLALTGASTYTGATVVSAGVLQIGAGGTTGAISTSSAVTIAAGGTLAFNRSDNFTFANAMSGAGTLRKVTTNDVDLTGSNSFSGLIDIQAGKLAINAVDSAAGAPSVNVASGATLSIGSPYAGGTATIGGLTGSGTVDPQFAGANDTRTLAIAQAANSTFAGVLKDGTSSRLLAVVKSGAGALTLTSSNSYTAGTTLAAGTIRIGNNGALGTGAVILNGGTLSSDGATARSLSNGLVIGGPITLGSTVDNGALTFSGTANLGGGTREITTASGVTMSGTISNGGLTKAGAGTLTLTVANTYTGVTTVSSGTLKFTGAGNIASTSGVQIASGAVFEWGRAADISRVFSGSGTILRSTATGNSVFSGANSSFQGTWLITTGYVGLTSDSVVGAANVGMTWTGGNGTGIYFTTTGQTLASTRTVTLSGAGGTLNGSTGHTGTFAALFTGTGSLYKVSGATAILTNVNDFTGDLFNNVGFLEIGGSGKLGGATGNYGGAISNVATLTFSTSENQTLSGSISGAGALNKSGAGTLSLTNAANTLTGNATITGGTLSFVSGALGPSGLVRMDGGTLRWAAGNTQDLGARLTLLAGKTASFDTNGNDVTLGSALGGGAVTAGLAKLGDGTLTLTATNVYTGATTISGGTLVIGAAGQLGSSGTYAGAIANNAAFVFATSANQTLSGALSGTGNLAKTGAGTLTLSGIANYAGTMTISTGTLVIGGGGTYAGAITNNASFVVNTSAATTISGAVGGTGGLVKNGSGALTLSGSNDYAGATTITAGSLLAGNDAALSTGTVTLTGGALAASGATPRTIANSIVFAGNAALGDATNNGLLTITGGVDLSGAVRQITTPSDVVITSVVSNGGLTKAGAGTLRLTNAANAYSGGSTISGGILSFVSGALGTTGAVTMNGGTLRWESGNTDDISPRLALVNGKTATFDTNGNDVTLASGLGAGTSAALAKAGGGTLTLSAATGYSGSTTVSGGTLALSGVGSIGSSSGLDLSASGAGFDISGASGDVTIGSLAGVNGSTVSLGTRNLTAGTAANTTFAGAIVGSGGFTKSGAGTLALAGVNTYTGDTTISTGTLQIGGAGQLGSGAYAGAIVNNAVLAFASSANQTLSGTVSGSGLLAKSGAGTLTLAAANTYTGATTISAGTLALSGSGSIESSSGLDLSAFGATLDISSASGDRTIGSLTGVDGSAIVLGTNVLTAGDATDATFAGVIAGSGGFTKAGAGTLVLSGNNAYTGPTTITTGTLEIGGGGVLGGGNYSGAISNAGTLLFTTSADQTLAGAIDGVGALVKSSASTLTLSASNAFSGPVSLDGGTLEFAAGALGTGTTTMNGGTLRWAGGNTEDVSSRLGFVDATTATLDTNGNDVTLANGFGAGTSAALTKVGGGTLTLSGSNGYSGATAVNEGTLAIAVAGSIASSPGLNIASGATLDIAGASGLVDVGTLTGEGSVTLGGNTLRTTVGGYSAFDGVISGSGGFTKAGTETLRITLAQTFTGTATVENGTIVLAGGTEFEQASVIAVLASGILDTPGLTIVSGQTLAGYGVVYNNISISSGGILSPGGSVGQLKGDYGDSTLTGGMTYVFEINDAGGTAGVSPGWDLFSTTGAITLAADMSNQILLDISTLDGTISGSAAGFDPNTSYAWKFLAAGAGNPIAFDATWFNLNSTGFLNPTTGGFSVARGDGLDVFGLTNMGDNELYVVYSAGVPEPGTLVLAAIGLAAVGVAAARRRRTRPLQSRGAR